MKELEKLVRPNIWRLKPYSSARDEFKGEASVFLDANENPYNTPYNRYPCLLYTSSRTKVINFTGQVKNIHLAAYIILFFQHHKIIKTNDPKPHFNKKVCKVNKIICVIKK